MNHFQFRTIYKCTGFCKEVNLDKILRAIKLDMKTKKDLWSLTTHDLVDKYSDSIWRFCRRLTFSKEDAEDLYQDTFLLAFEKMDKINTSDNPQNYIFSISLHLWKSRKQKYARRNRIVPIQPLNDELIIASDFDMEDSIMAKEDNRMVRELVHNLPEKFKIPIILHYTIEMSLSDIAATISLPIGTVKSRLHKARKIIEKGLIENGYGE